MKSVKRNPKVTALGFIVTVLGLIGVAFVVMFCLGKGPWTENTATTQEQVDCEGKEVCPQPEPVEEKKGWWPWGGKKKAANPIPAESAEEKK